MDDRFDRLSRAMAGALPRRQALKLIAATAAGIGAAALGLRPRSVDAACTGTCSGGVCSATCCGTAYRKRLACNGKGNAEQCTC